jgi:hypothetical protein
LLIYSVYSFYMMSNSNVSNGTVEYSSSSEFWLIDVFIML